MERTAPLFDYEFSIGNSLLKCPRCDNFDYLHHGGVEIFHRIEDASSVHRVSIDADGLIEAVGPVVNAESLNPSTRRGGIVIHFDCEGCGEGLMLNIAQHKGQTLLGWTFTPSDQESENE